MSVLRKIGIAILGPSASLVLVTAAALVPGAVAVSAAGATQSATDQISGITATTPATYGRAYPNCSPAGPDAVTFTNVQPQDSLGPGSITVEAVLANGSRQTLDTITVNYSGASGSTVSFPIAYSAWANVPTQPNGTKEFHVDISVPVFVNGVTQPNETFDGSAPFIGPLDWDVYCTGNPTTPPAVCTSTAAITSNFNGTAIGNNATIWFSSVFKVNGSITQPTTITITNSTVSYVLNGVTSTLSTPDAQITITPGATTASTTFSNGTFMTSLPAQFSGNGFLDGFALPLPGGLPGGVNSVTWSATFGFSQPNVSINWQWAAAAYSQFNTNYAALNVIPVDDNHFTGTSDHAGTPESVKQYVVGGARGGGGSNYTGSLSGTGSVKCA